MDEPKHVDYRNDDPLAGDDVTADHLGRREFAKSAVDVLEGLRHSEASSVIGLVGPWGGGKTSVLNMIKSLLVDRPREGAGGWIISDFNPWFFQDMISLQTAYFRELGAAIPDQGKGERARTRLAAFGSAVAPLGSIVATLGGPDVSKSVQAISDLIAPDGSVAKIHAKLEKLLRELGRPLLMVLDDLDRLAPDELLLTLKLIRLIGRLPNVHYLIAYDEETLLDCLSRTGLVGDDTRRGVDYLEKIIQVRLDVPPARQYQLDKWIEGALLDLQERFGLDFGGEARRRLTHAFYGHMRERLTTPRAVKRYFSQVEAFLGVVHEEVDAVDFLVLTWFRTAEPLVYDLISQERSALLGEVKNVEAADLLGKPDKDRVREFWAVRLEAARVSPVQMEGVAELIGLLFPRFRAHWNREDIGQGSKVPAGRIQNPDYFDRYFAFGVPPEDISDDDDGILTPEMQSRWVAQQVYVSLSGDEAIAVIDALAKELGGLELASHLIAGAANEHSIQRSPERAAVFEAAAHRFAASVHSFMEQYEETALSEVPAGAWGLLRDWQLFDQEAAGSWLQSHIDSGAWPLIDVVARFVSRRRFIGVPDAPWTISDLNIGLVDRLLNIDNVIAVLDEEIKAAEPVDPDLRRLEDTFENRCAVALSQLKRFRREQRASDSDDTLESGDE